MRIPSLLGLAIVPAVILAQAPAGDSLTSKYEKAGPVVKDLLKVSKGAEALAHLESLIPPTAPAYAMPTVDELKAAYPQQMTAIQDSQANYRALAGLYSLKASCHIALGQWEQAREPFGKAIETAKANATNFRKASESIRALWTELSNIGAEFKAKNEEQVKTLTAKETRTAEEENFLTWYKQNVPVHEGNIDKAKQMHAILDKEAVEADKIITMVSDPLAKLEETNKKQAEEIQKFNDDKNAKRKKKDPEITGNKAWVDAVLNKEENITGLPTPRNQVEFLNRLLVLDPENTRVKTCIDNILAGKEPFYKEPKAPKTTKAKTTKAKK